MKKLLIASLLACAFVPAISNAALLNIATAEGTAVAVGQSDFAIEIIGNTVGVTSDIIDLFTVKVTNNTSNDQLVDVDATPEHREGSNWRVKNPNGDIIDTQVWVGTGRWAGIGIAKTNGGSITSSQATIPANGFGTLLVKARPTIPGQYTFKATLNLVTN